MIATKKEPENWRLEYQRLRDEGLRAVERGSLHEALAFAVAQLDYARVVGDPAVCDQARLSVASVEIELGRLAGPAELQAILLRSGQSENGFFAAYNLARYYELEKNSKKAVFYARVANKQAQRCLRSDLLAMSLNQLGNLFMVQSRFEEAAAEYAVALEHVPKAAGVKRALIQDNMGYCHAASGSPREGVALLVKSLRTLRRFSARRYESGPRLSLCYAYLELDKPMHALRHGAAAAAIAERVGDHETLKNALFLLGEAQKQAGDELAARRHFRRLQERYYPHESYLPDLLLLVDVRNMVNLKA